MHRFFVTPDAIHRQTMVHFSERQAQQIQQVLRLQPGAKVAVLDNAGVEYDVTLAEVTRGRVLGRIEGQRAAAGEPQNRLTLYQSLLPRDKFEWVLQKGTEVGVHTFVPVITRRTLVRESKAAANKQERWERIIQEAAEQAGRGRLPFLHPPLTFAGALERAAASDCRMIPWEKAAGTTVGMALNRLPTGVGQATIALFIGPEGGFEEREIEQAQAAGAVTVTLGPRILRTETAAVVSAALILYELGDLNGERV
jgi:16S rRNA (uracil1498-N3)-methyltransferase